MTFNPQSTADLIEAVMARDVVAMRAALQAGADPDTMIVTAPPLPLLWEVVCESVYDEGMVQALLDAGANPNVARDNGVCVLALALMKEEMVCVRALVAAGGDVNFQYEKNVSKTVLYYAVSNDVLADDTCRTSFILSHAPDLGRTMSGDGHGIMQGEDFTVPMYLDRLRESIPERADAVHALRMMVMQHEEGLAAREAALAIENAARAQRARRFKI